ncbi:putative repeat protein (TIGR01451 family), partial [Arcicella aurantiaca]
MKTHFQKQTSLIARWLQTVFILVAMIVVGQQANAQAPGGVTTGLRLWLKANDGTNTTTQGGSISSWQDKSGLGFHVVQTNANWQPFYHENARNFNPVVRFTGSESIGNTKANLIIPATTNPMTLINAFQCTRTTALYHTLVSFGGGADYPSDHINGDKYLSYVEATSHVATYHPTLLEGKFTVGYSTHANLAGTAGVRQIGFNGLQNMYLPPITDGTFPAGGFTGNFSVGAQKPDGIAEPFVGDIPEVIVYNRVLTNVELQKAQSYIALKYGITMDKATNYLNSSGSIMWPATQDYGSNVFGIARDDASALNQKVSQSTDAGGVLKMALQNDFVSSNQDASRTVSLVDGQSLMVGDNGQPLSLYTTFALSCGSIANSVKLSTVWKVANINSVGGVILKMDFAASGINDQPYIIIGSSPTFGAGTYRKIDGTMNDDGTTATFTVKLKNGEYFTFGGVRGAGVCPKCAYSSTTLEWDKAPFWPIPTASNTAVTRTLGTGQNLSMIFNDPQGVEFAKGVRPIRYGKTLLLDRWDNLTPTGTPNGGAYTGVFTMDKASKVKFDINAIDRWAVDCKDIVEIKGYCGTTLIMPILTAVDEAHKTFTISGNVATGNSKWSGYFDKRGKLNVYFDRAVNKIEIIWKSTKGGTGNRFQRIGIGNVQFICPEVDDVCAMNDDDVIFKRLIADGVTAKKTCENLRFEYKLKNLSCVVAKVVNLTDVLPAGMAWITDGYEAGTYGGTTNAYAGTTNLSVTSITIPPGMEISVFASAKFTNTGSAGYANKASITVNGGTVGAIQSNCGNNNTWSSTSAQPAPVPTISHTVDKTCYKQNEVLTFTVTVNNTTGAAITGVEFKTALEGKFTMVGSSVSTTLGGTIALPDGQSSYDGLEFLEITGMSIPTGTSTFAYQVRTNTSDSTFVMKSTISADPNSDCAEEASQKTNEITLAPCPPCTAGTAVPVITQTTATNTCPAITVNLATMTNTGTKPAGTNLVWSTRKTPNSPTDTLSNLNVGAGKYYALYRDKVSGCFGTGGADSVMVTISLCVSTPSPRIPSAGGNDSGNAGTELNPIGGTQPYNYTNGSGDAGCVAPTGSPAYQY